MNRNRQFWLVYSVAWLADGASFGAVLIGVGNRFNFNLLTAILCNILPASLLGMLAVRMCRWLKWSGRREPQFIFIHIFWLLLFGGLWCFLTVLSLSIVSWMRSGEWLFVDRWNSYAYHWQFFSGVMAYATIASAVYVQEVNENLRGEERRNAELSLRALRAEAARASAELAALRAQFNPHFLFNTLHSLMALVRSDADTAEQAIERFAAMLRYVLQSQSEKNAPKVADVRFADEWEFVQNYLELERLRLGDRLQLKTDIEPAALNYHLPAFLLQPIVENAVKYAVSPRAGGGQINITAQISGENLIIEVGDDGDGKSIKNEANGNGFGLRLVRESLAARFGVAASLTTEPIDNAGFKVSMIVPKTFSSPVNFEFSENRREIL